MTNEDAMNAMENEALREKNAAIQAYISARDSGADANNLAILGIHAMAAEKRIIAVRHTLGASYTHNLFSIASIALEIGEYADAMAYSAWTARLAVNRGLKKSADEMYTQASDRMAASVLDRIPQPSEAG